MLVWVKHVDLPNAVSIEIEDAANLYLLAGAVVNGERLQCPASAVEFLAGGDSDTISLSTTLDELFRDNSSPNSSVNPLQYKVAECGSSEINSCGIVSTVQEKINFLLSGYQDALQRAPLKTKSITAFFISVLGEVICTYLNAKKAQRRQVATFNRHPESELTQNPFMDSLALVYRNINWKRLVTFGALGGAVAGPVFHYWYAYLDQLSMKVTDNLFKFLHAHLITEPRSIEQVRASVMRRLVKLSINQVLFTPPWVLCQLMFVQCCLAALSGGSYADAVRNVKNIYAATLLSNLKLWTPCQIINFAYVPLEYSVLFGNFVAVWWNIYLSAVN